MLIFLGLKFLKKNFWYNKNKKLNYYICNIVKKFIIFDTLLYILKKMFRENFSYKYELLLSEWKIIADGN